MNNVLSYVIRTKNEEKFLEETCRRIKRQSHRIMHEIVIVDSGSTDTTLDIAKKYADKIITIRAEEFSWGRALNIGIAASSGDVICLISGHCLLEDDSICEAAYYHLVASDYACLYGRQKGNVFLDKMEAIELAVGYPKETADSLKTKYIPGISNACCMLKRKVWEKYKFDETAQSAEDGIWYSEITKGGYVAEYYPYFIVIHGHHFNIEYMYKKWYWRIYKSEKISGRCNNWRTSNRIRFLLAFLNGMTRKSREFYDWSVKEKIKITKRNCKKYFFIREYAACKAKFDLKANKNGNLKYEELQVPLIIKNMQRKIIPGDFYEI